MSEALAPPAPTPPAEPPVARPPTPAAVAAELAAGRACGFKLLARGLATRAGPGAAPVRVDRIVSTELLRRVVEHEPGDQTITVQAGLSLTELDERLAACGQWLPVQAGAGTVGGLLSSGADGALDLGYGRLRDRLLGCTIALANGALVGSRGRVVKNVAGYDLGRMMIGSLGTLGIVVEASFRVQPRPEWRSSLVFRFETSAAAFAAADALLDSGLEPVFVDVLLSGNVPAASPAMGVHLAFGFDGTRAIVGELIAAADRLVRPHAPAELELGAGERDDGLRAALHAPRGAALLRLQTLRTQTAEVASRLVRAAHATGVKVLADARPGLGLVFLGLDDAGDDVVRALLAEARAVGPTVLLRGPEALNTADEIWGPPPPDMAVLATIKHALDPDGVLATGRYVGGL